MCSVVMYSVVVYSVVAKKERLLFLEGSDGCFPFFWWRMIFFA